MTNVRPVLDYARRTARRSPRVRVDRGGAAAAVGGVLTLICVLMMFAGILFAMFGLAAFWLGAAEVPRHERPHYFVLGIVCCIIGLPTAGLALRLLVRLLRPRRDAADATGRVAGARHTH